MKTMNEYFEGDLTNLYYLNDYDSFEAVSSYHIENKDHSRIFFASPYLSFGDYDNSCDVERSNVRVFLEIHESSEDIEHQTGSYGSEAIYINTTTENEDILETLSALENYPCIDDQDVSLMNIEMFADDWDSWIEREFIDKILKDLDLCDIEYECADLLDWFNELTEAENIYFEVQAGGSGWIDVDRLTINKLPDTIKAVEYS